jgi:hypothetical protein
MYGTSFGVRPSGNSEARKRIDAAGLKFQRENPQPEAVDQERVIALWAEGLSGSAIADRLGIYASYARTIVQRAREHGDPRAIKRGPGRPKRPPVDEYLAMEAHQRGMTVAELRKRIVDHIVNDRLIAAVLDH